MIHRLIQKINREQELLEDQSMEAALSALGIVSLDQKKIMDDFRWLRNMKKIQEEAPTDRMKKNCQIAYDKYLMSVEAGITALGQPLKLADWKRAGEAMESVFRSAARQNMRE